MYDFAGWATKNDIRCSDGRIIRHNAFKDCDGKTVPLVWNHDHHSVMQVLGHATLENKDEGVRALCSFNDTESGKNGLELVRHGDIVSLSIYANQLKQQGSDVVHGNIREVSLVLAGANPGALIDSVIRHGEMSDEEAVIYTGEQIELYHADNKEDDKSDTEDGNTVKKESKGKTLQDIYDSFTEEQKRLVGYLVADAKENAADRDDAKHSDLGGNMKYNVFADQHQAAGSDDTSDVLTHAEILEIFEDAKTIGSLKKAVIAHNIEDIDLLFPESTNRDTPPEWIKRPTGWVSVVMNSVHRSPTSRVKSMQANITEDEARARGYIKGHLKKEQVFSLLRRTTSPKTVYKTQKMDRDDILDITDFDAVAWIKAEMRGMLDEEIARAILVSDGRDASDEYKIDELNIRPIWKDADLYAIKTLLTLPAATTPDQKAKAFIRACVKSRKNYRGSGRPTLFTTEDLLTDMLLLEDLNGRIIYDSEAKLATALRVGSIETVPVMENLTREVGGVTHQLDGIIVNLDDYNVGRDRGGEVNTFDQFDIDYNKYTYLIETRCSGALVRPFSAIVMESVVSENASTVTFTSGTMLEAFVQATELGYTNHRSGKLAVDEFTGDGSTVAFTLSHNSAYADLDHVTVDDTEVTAYTLSGKTLTFATAPANAKEIKVVYHYIP